MVVGDWGSGYDLICDHWGYWLIVVVGDWGCVGRDDEADEDDHFNYYHRIVIHCDCYCGIV